MLSRSWVLIRDRVTDDKLLMILKEVLGSNIMDDAQTRSGVESRQGGIVDPVFAAGMEVAIRAKQRLDQVG